MSSRMPKKVEGDDDDRTVEGQTGCVDGLLWIGQTYPKFFCGRARSCVKPERPQGPHCFVHEAERRGVSRRVSHIPPWAVPGQSRIFLAHRGGEKNASRGRIFGYFVLNRTEVLTPSAALAPPKTRKKSRKGEPVESAAAKDQPNVRTEKCWDGEVIVTHRYDPDRKRWVRTSKRCPDPPELPECEDGEFRLAKSEDGESIATHVYGDGEWQATGAAGSERVPVEDEAFVDHRGCSLRCDPGAVYLVDGLAAGIADAFSARLDRGSIRRRDDVAAGRKLFNEVVDGVASEWVSRAMVPSTLRGKASARGGLVLFHDPPLFEKRPRASFRSLAHIDGEHLLDQIADGVRKPAIRTCRERAGVTTQQEVVAVLAERAHANKAFTRQLLTGLSDLAQEELENHGEFRVPGMGTLRRGKDGRLRFDAYKALREPKIGR